MRLRASSLPILRNCPGYASLPDEPEGDGTDYASEGTARHAGIAALLMGEPIPAELTPTQAADAADAVDWLPDDITDVTPLGVEMEHSAEIEGVTLTGHTDAEWQGLVLDHKTGGGQPFNLPPIEDDLQMRAYGWLAGEGGPITVGRYLTDVQRLDVLDLDEDGARENAEILADVVRFVRDHKGEFITGGHCLECYGRTRCDAYQARADLLPVLPRDRALTDSEASRALVALGAAKALVKRVEAELKEHARVTPIARDDGKVWAPSTYNTTRIKDGNAAFLRLYALNPNEALAVAKVAKGDVEAAVRRAGGDPDQVLAEMVDAGEAKTTETTSFRWRKA